MSSLPKIFLIGPTAPYRGGIADTQASFAQALKKKGVTLTLVNFKKLYPDVFFPGKSQFREENTDHDVPESIRRLHAYAPINWIKTANWINSHQPDYVIVRYWTPFLAPCWWGLRFLLNKKTKMIGLVDNWKPHEKKWSDALLQKIFKNSCDRFATLSKTVADQIRLQTTKPVWQGFHPINNRLPKPIDTRQARAQLVLPKDRTIAAFVGLIRPYKGLDFLIKSFAAAHQKAPNLYLVVAGECYTNIASYKQLIAELKLQNHVHLNFNFLSDQKLRDYLCAANFVCQPYQSATQSGITPLAYAYQKPLMVSDIDGLKGPIVEDSSGRVVVREIAEWGNALVDFSKKDALDVYTKNIQKALPKYQWDHFCEHFLAWLKI